MTFETNPGGHNAWGSPYPEQTYEELTGRPPKAHAHTEQFTPISNSVEQPPLQWPTNGEAPQQPRLIAGRLCPKKLALNLGVLAVLGAIVSAAVVWVADLIISTALTGAPVGTGSAAFGWAVISALVAVVAGMLFIPVLDTANEGMFQVVIYAGAVIASIVWVVLAGVMVGNFSALTALAGIICCAGMALAAPSRIVASEYYS